MAAALIQAWQREHDAARDVAAATAAVRGVVEALLAKHALKTAEAREAAREEMAPFVSEPSRMSWAVLVQRPGGDTWVEVASTGEDEWLDLPALHTDLAAALVPLLVKVQGGC